MEYCVAQSVDFIKMVIEQKLLGNYRKSDADDSTIPSYDRNFLFAVE